MFELKKIGKHWLIRPTGGQFSQLDIPIGAKHVEITDTFLVIDEQVYEIKASGNIAYVEKLPVISLTEEKHEPRNESSDASVIQPPVPSENLTSHQENIKSHAEPEKNADRNISTGIEDAHTEYDSLEASHTKETSEIEIIQVKKKDNDDERNNLSKGASGESPLHSPLNEEGKEEQINKLIAEVEAAIIDLSQDMPSNRLDSVLSEHMEHNYQERETQSSKTASKTNRSDKPTFGKSFDDLWKNNRHVRWRFPRENQLVVGEIDSSCLHHEPVIFLTEQDTPHDKIPDYQKSPLAFSIQVPTERWTKHKALDKMKRALQTIERSGAFDILVVVKNVHKSATLRVVLYEIFQWLNYKSKFRATVFFGCSTADIYKMLTEIILEAKPSTDFTVNDASKLEETDTHTLTNIRQEPYMYNDKQVQKSQKHLTPIANETASLGFSSSRRYDDVVNSVQDVEDGVDKTALETETCTDHQPNCVYSIGHKYSNTDLDMQIQRKENNSECLYSVPDPVRIPLPAEVVFDFLKSRYIAEFSEFENMYGKICLNGCDMIIPSMQDKRCEEFINKVKMHSKELEVFETSVNIQYVNAVTELSEEFKKKGKFCQFDLENMKFFVCIESFEDMLKCKHLYKLRTGEIKASCGISRKRGVFIDSSKDH